MCVEVECGGRKRGGEVKSICEQDLKGERLARLGVRMSKNDK